MAKQREDGYWIDIRDQPYETRWEAEAADLGLCSCGQPEEAFNFCRAVLACFDRRGRGGTDWVWAEQEVKKLVLAQPQTAAHVISHLMNSHDVLEHGGTVGGSWLTIFGEDIVDAPPAPIEDEP